MKMKSKTNVLLMALAMCLFLLSACGADKAEEAAAPENVSESIEQQSADAQEEQPEQEEPEETEEPEEEEPEQAEPEEAEEPEPEEVEEQNNAGAEFLALLQEEYENGFVVGEGAKHTYYWIMLDPYDDAARCFLYDGVIYRGALAYYDPYRDSSAGAGSCCYNYDIASKELKNWYDLNEILRSFNGIFL